MKWLKNDLGPKLLSVAIAISLWFYVVQVQSPDIEKTIKGVPVVFTQKSVLEDKGLILLNDKETTIDVKIKGRRKYLVDVDSSKLTVLADVSTIEETGLHSIFTNIVLPPGNLEVVNKTPAMLTINVDNLSTVEKEIDIITTGEPKSDYIVGNISRTSKNIVVKGPKSIVDGINRVVAELEVSGKDYDVVTVSPIKLYDSNDKEINTPYVTFDQANIEIRCEILKTKTVNIVPLFANETAAGEFLPDSNNTKSVRIAGAKDVVDGLTEINTKPILSNDINDKNETTVDLELPSGVRSLDGEKFIFRFSKKPVE